MTTTMDMATVVPSVLLGAGLALTPAPLLGLWDELALRRVRDCLELGKTVRLTEEQVRQGMRLWGIAMAVVPAVVWWLFGTPILVAIALPLVYQSPRWILNTLIERRRRRLRDQLVPVCYALANAVRAGLSLPQAIGLIARESSEPMRGELARILREYEAGRTLEHVLRDASERLDLSGFRMFTAALLCCLEHGGPLTETLDQIAQTIQEDHRLRGRMDVQTASGRLTLTLLAVFPVVFLLMTYLAEPQLASRVFSMWQGQVALLAAMILTVAAVRMGLKIIRIESVA